MLQKIDHVGVAVQDLEQALQVFSTQLGIEVGGIEEVADQKIKVAFLPVGESKIELLQPTDPDGAVAKFIKNRGEGIQHIAFKVQNLEESLARLKQSGVRLIDEKPRIGAGGAKIAFIHPKSTCGVLIELCER